MRGLLGSALIAVALPGSALAAPALWRIADTDNAVWLFGSVHMLPPDLEWRTELFDKVIEKSELVYFETTMDPATIESVARITTDFGFYAPGTSLADHVDDPQFEQIDAVLQPFGLSASAMSRVQPWFMAFMIDGIAAVGASFNPAFGVETILQAEVPTDLQFSLESGEAVMQGIATQPIDIQVDFLVSTLENYSSSGVVSDMFRDLVDTWADGDQAKLEELVSVSLPPDGEMTRILLADRNQSWVEPIVQLIEGSSDAIVIAGAAHFVGDMGVLSLLEDRGYSVERIQ